MTQIATNVLPVQSVAPSSLGDGTFRYIDIASIDRAQKTIVNPALIEYQDAPSRARQLVRTNDVLVSTVRPNLNAVAHIPIELDGAIASTGFTVLRPDSGKLDSRYLFHWVRTKRFIGEMTRLATGASYPAVSDAVVKRSEIPLPPLEEQRRIAEVLDRADALRHKRRLAIQKLDALLRSVFLDMFGDPIKNPKGWDVKEFGEIAKNEDSKRVPVKSSDRAGIPGRYPYYGASGIIDYVDEYIFDGQRLLIAEDGANLLARSTPIAFIAEGQYWVNNHAHVVAFNGTSILKFLEILFSFTDLRPYITGSAQPKLNRSSLDRIQFTVPPLDLQKQFAAIVEKIETTRKKLTSALGETERLFGSLQHRAFKGELFNK